MKPWPTVRWGEVLRHRKEFIVIDDLTSYKRPRVQLHVPGIVPPECEGCVVSPEFPVFEVDEDRVVHEVLDTCFRTPSVWPELAGESSGTNVRRRRLNPQDFLDYEMPLPSRGTQMTLREVRAEVDALKRLQAETAAELAALLPALLDRAFKGDL